MSGVLLQQAVVDMLRAALTTEEVRDVRAYEGEFGAAEVGQLTFTCPAVLVTVAGWQPAPNATRLTGRHVRRCKVFAFVVTKHAQRPARGRQAMALAERVQLAVEQWRPLDNELVAIAPPEDACTAENLFSRKLDEKGLALWCVDWEQAVKALVPAGQLYDLLRVDIEDHVRRGDVPAPVPPASTPITATEDIQFPPDTPPEGT